MNVLKYTSALTAIFLFSFINNSVAQHNKPNHIYLEIVNIPKIQHKIFTSKTSWRIDKSPTITYKLINNPKSHEIKFNQLTRSVAKRFYKDQVFLKLRYNPGKYAELILRKGDSVIIEYSDNKPFIEVLSRTQKKYDNNVSELLDTFKFPMDFFEFRNKFKRGRTKKERKQEAKEYVIVYNKQIKMLDSLHKNKLLSTLEYQYHKKNTTYLSAIKAKNYNKEVLKENYLHIDSYPKMLDDFVFQQLKKKIINLGNGMARNFLECFDVAFANSDFPIPHKEYLLSRYLKEVKKDHPFSTYDNRLSKYKKWKKENKLSKIEIKDLEYDKLRNIHKIVNTVELTDINQRTTTLKEILNNNKGKVVYIDFWASWCAPCRASFPAYKKLKKEYKNKSVAFVFISTDKDTSKWEKAIAEENLMDTNLATNYPNAEFYQQLNLKRIPRYLVFDKSGKLAHLYAPGPDSDGIRDLLNKLLEE